MTVAHRSRLPMVALGVCCACLSARVATALDPSASSDAEVVAREDLLFGAEQESDDPIFEQEADDSLDARLASQLQAQYDILAIGGFSYLRLDLLANDDTAVLRSPITSPSLLDVYFDARPTERLRFLARGRLRHDFTEGTSPGPLEGFFGQDASTTQAQLDQLWLKFDLYRRVYVTAGRQPIRWGSGRLWNPTDFLNSQARDPLALFDERLGIGAIRLHMPVESLGWNFYAIANMAQASSLDKIGGAVRGEWVLGLTELALSVAYRDDAPWQFGADWTAAVWDFDIRLEGALQHGITTPRFEGRFRLPRSTDDGLVFDPDTDIPKTVSQEDDWLAQIVAGAEVAIRYSDEDNAVLGVEYFYNQLGYERAQLVYLIATGNYRPLYSGRHYGAAYLALVAPGRWDDSTFLVNVIGNLSDGSYLGRIDVQVTVLTRLSINAYCSYHMGNRGEFKLSLNAPGAGEIIDELLPDGLPEGLPTAALRDGISVPAPLFSTGLGLRLSF